MLVFLTGCGAESGMPLPIEKLNGTPPVMEGSIMDLDARGVINGNFQPGNVSTYDVNFYPVNYTGSWTLISHRGNLYSITCAEKGARIDIVATLSRVTFDFLDPDTYDNPGSVTFLIDNKPLGVFVLKRKGNNGDNLMDYQISSQKNTVATISMILNSGRVSLAGYLLTFFDRFHHY